ncbi:TetR/AcrR family transcriptional regulator [Glutamicibacter halophytocola]|uniref:TetR/AcrR family transcriptional regulator n=1 Tax=Glutamicibacter halophytocola TaxID=1933880 RepID=UPI00321A781F
MARSKRGSYTVGLERRERILEAASERFSSSGYSRTSLAEIARDVGITTPGLTHHFPTKQHLLLAIAERRFDISQSIADAATGELDGTRTPRLLLSLSGLFASHPGLIELFVLISAEAADPSNPAHALFQERYTRISHEIAEFFMAEVHSGAAARGSGLPCPRARMHCSQRWAATAVRAFGGNAGFGGAIEGLS